MDNHFSKRELRERLEFTTDVEVARFFGISGSAVSQWGEDEPLPELRQLQAARKRPDLFDPESTVARPGAVAEGSAAETTPAVPVSEAA